jgi:hypothetical protein
VSCRGNGVRGWMGGWGWANLAGDATYVRLKPQVQHAVGFVQHKIRDAAQSDRAILHQVLQPAGRRDDHVHAAAQRLGLPPPRPGAPSAAPVATGSARRASAAPAGSGPASRREFLGLGSRVFWGQGFSRPEFGGPAMRCPSPARAPALGFRVEGWRTWGPFGTPPYVHSTLKPPRRPASSKTTAICCVSSRVGDNTSMLGPLPAGDTQAKEGCLPACLPACRSHSEN